LIEKCTEINSMNRISILEAKERLLEILFDYYNQHLYFGHDTEMGEGMINIFKNLNSINNIQKYHLLKKIQKYMIQYFNICAKNKNQIKISLCSKKKVDVYKSFMVKNFAKSFKRNFLVNFF